MGRVLFTADHHFGHRAVIGYCQRPFADVAEMDRAMIECWNRAVRPEDAVFHLGDFALGPAERTAELLSGLNGHKVLVLGNHDRSAKRMVELGFDEAYKEAAHEGWRLKHWPPPEDDPEPTLCGHVHGLWERRGAAVNVGVDVRGYCPLSLEEINPVAPTVYFQGTDRVVPGVRSGTSEGKRRASPMLICESTNRTSREPNASTRRQVPSYGGRITGPRRKNLPSHGERFGVDGPANRRFLAS